MKSRPGLSILFGLLLIAPGLAAESPAPKPLRELFTKQEVRIPMRDGAKLFTAIYAPKDTTRKYPFLMMRTPYSVGPYGADAYRGTLGPSNLFHDQGYIFVYQDVRGCYQSEGTFVNMTPHGQKIDGKQIDESTDTHDTITWLIKHVPNNNGRVGQYGISYPGFYAAAGMIDAHPALKAVSPQAPIADWWYDDFHHHGAFFLPHAFNFLASFGRPRPKPTTSRSFRFEHGTPDGYQFFLDLGPMINGDKKHFKGEVAFWNEMCDHPNYDAFWQARNLLPHLKKTAPAVLTVGGWYDTEDLYGPLKIYRAVEKNNPGTFNALVMGPWSHGGWAGGSGDRLGNISNGSATAEFYRKNIELPFFNQHLHDKGDAKLPEAYVFETGANQWRQFDTWPPKQTQTKSLYVHAGGKLSFSRPTEDQGHDEYISDPAKPVPFTEAISVGMAAEYMTDDQRFAARRPDVLTYQTDVLTEDLTLVGPLLADLRVSTSGTDSDWVVKLIDVYPSNAQSPIAMPAGRSLGGYQQMVRSEVMRGRFRNDPAKPEAFVPNEPTQVKLELLDVLHTFRKGHRVMIQIQSTWFPLVDRNPQTFVPNIYRASEKDFVKATQRIHRSKSQPTSIAIGVLPK